MHFPRALDLPRLHACKAVHETRRSHDRSGGAIGEFTRAAITTSTKSRTQELAYHRAAGGRRWTGFPHQKALLGFRLSSYTVGNWTVGFTKFTWNFDFLYLLYYYDLRHGKQGKPLLRRFWGNTKHKTFSMGLNIEYNLSRRLLLLCDKIRFRSNYTIRQSIIKLLANPLEHA